MFVSETSAVNHNARNNNNIVWKNISVFDNDPNNVVGPVSVYLGCAEAFQGGYLEIQSAQNSLGKLIHELGNVYIELTEPLKSDWLNEGMPGNNFMLTEEGYLEILGEEFRIEGINVEDCGQFVNVYFEPFSQNRFAAFDLVQFDNEGALVGGERFEYRPQVRVEQRSNEEWEVLVVQSDKLRLYPNPTSGMLNVTVKDFHTDVASIEIYDMQGRKITQTTLSEKVNIQIDVTNFSPGLYFLKVKDRNGKHIDDLRFVKE